MTIEWHLQAEQIILPDIFAICHPKYQQYLTYQYVVLNNLHQQNPGAWEELVKDDFGGCLGNQPFSTEHGDLIIETTAKWEVKGCGGPM